MRSEWNATLSIFFTGILLGEVFVHTFLQSGDPRPVGSDSSSTASSAEDTISDHDRLLEAQYQRQLEQLRALRRSVAPAPAQSAAVVAESVAESPQPPQKPQPVPQEQKPPPPENRLPPYDVLHSVGELKGRRTYGEILLPTLSPATPMKELVEYAKMIARQEGFDSMTLYCTLEAQEAHYSMDYADSHPAALLEGLLGVYDRGRFKPGKSR